MLRIVGSQRLLRARRIAEDPLIGFHRAEGAHPRARIAGTHEIPRFSIRILISGGTEVGPEKDARNLKKPRRHEFDNGSGIQFRAVKVEQRKGGVQEKTEVVVPDFQRSRAELVLLLLRQICLIFSAGPFPDGFRQKMVPDQFLVTEQRAGKIESMCGHGLSSVSAEK